MQGSSGTGYKAEKRLKKDEMTRETGSRARVLLTLLPFYLLGMSRCRVQVPS